MPKPGMRVDLSPDFIPAQLNGITIHPENPLIFDFIIFKGDKLLSDGQKPEEYKKLVKYFLASLAIPDQDQWVNLSPYEKNRIIKDDFGKTLMGRDLLAQDYILKQITASLIYPEEGLGKKFWNQVYAKAQEQLGTTNVAVNTFNKVWILPDQALIYEKGNTAYVLKSHLKVMLEEDYLALSKHRNQSGDMFPRQGGGTFPQVKNSTHTINSQLIREIVLPALEKEVNEGRNFAMLRQVYSGMLLATWFKKTLKRSLLGQIYADKTKVKGIDQNPQNNEAIYQRYLQAYKKGVFNYIKEDVDQFSNEEIPRKYFSGGLINSFAMVTKITEDQAVGSLAMKAAENGLDSVEVAMDENKDDQHRGAGVDVIQKKTRMTPQELRQKLEAAPAKKPYTLPFSSKRRQAERQAEDILFQRSIAQERLNTMAAKLVALNRTTRAHITFHVVPAGSALDMGYVEKNDFSPEIWELLKAKGYIRENKIGGFNRNHQLQLMIYGVIQPAFTTLEDYTKIVLPGFSDVQKKKIYKDLMRAHLNYSSIAYTFDDTGEVFVKEQYMDIVPDRELMAVLDHEIAHNENRDDLMEAVMWQSKRKSPQHERAYNLYENHREIECDKRFLEDAVKLGIPKESIITALEKGIAFMRRIPEYKEEADAHEIRLRILQDRIEHPDDLVDFYTVSQIENEIGAMATAVGIRAKTQGPLSSPYQRAQDIFDAYGLIDELFGHLEKAPSDTRGFLDYVIDLYDGKISGTSDYYPTEFKKEEAERLIDQIEFMTGYKIPNKKMDPVSRLNALLIDPQFAKRLIEMANNYALPDILASIEGKTHLSPGEIRSVIDAIAPQLSPKRRNQWNYVDNFTYTRPTQMALAFDIAYLNHELKSRVIKKSLGKEYQYYADKLSHLRDQLVLLLDVSLQREERNGPERFGSSKSPDYKGRDAKGIYFPNKISEISAVDFPFEFFVKQVIMDKRLMPIEGPIEGLPVPRRPWRLGGKWIPFLLIPTNLYVPQQPILPIVTGSHNTYGSQDVENRTTYPANRGPLAHPREYSASDSVEKTLVSILQHVLTEDMWKGLEGVKKHAVKNRGKPQAISKADIRVYKGNRKLGTGFYGINPNRNKPLSPNQ